ncbi:MAG TPA: hypothetical protein VH637_21525 [Streptosporangiaceae bacterium]|jgi:hypothetical protein
MKRQVMPAGPRARALAAMAAGLIAAVSAGLPATAGASALAQAGTPFAASPGPAAAAAAGPAATAARPSDLAGVAATSARNAWAAGFRSDGRSDQTLIEHWNGKSWRQVISPDPGGSAAGASNQLNAVAATSARNAWAVGSWTDGKVTRMLILHWTGRSWHATPAHFPGCMKDNDGLYGVSATSGTDAWAVGEATSCVFGDKITVIFHWNGHSWHEVTSPDPGAFHDNYLRAVTATSARDAWAAGFYSDGGPVLPMIVHWNGKSWTQVPCPDPIDADIALGGIAASSARNAWAVGLATTGSLGSSQTLVFHWNGTSWRQAPAPDQPGQGLAAVAALPGRAPWAAGFRTSQSQPVQTLAERWNGHAWKPVSSPNPGPSPHIDELLGVALVPGGGAWAVGAYDDGKTLKALIERWNGTSWRVQH